MLKKYVDTIVNRPWLTVIVMILLVAIAGAGISKLWFSADFEVYFDENDPYLNAYHNLQNTFTKDDNVLLIVAPKLGSVFSEKQLTLLKELTDKAWHLPYAARVDSIANFQHTKVKQDELVISDLVGDISKLSTADIKKIQEIALSDPALVNRLISPSGHVAAVNVTVSLGDTERQYALMEVASAVRALARQLEESYGDVSIHLTGGVMMDVTFAEATIGDMSTLTPLMYLVVILMLLIIFRSFKAMLATLMVIVFSTIAAMGSAGWLAITLSPPTSAATTIILTLAVAGCVHLMSVFLSQLTQKSQKEEALRECLRVIVKPIFICSITTMVGFLSFNFSESPPFRDLGNIVALGVVWTFLLVVVLLPAVIILIPKWSVGKTEKNRSFSLAGLGLFVVKYQKLILLLSPVVIGVPAAFVTNNVQNDEYVRYFDESVPFRQATEFAEANLGGTYMIDYSLSTGESGGINSPDYLHKVEAFSAWYKTLPEVRHVAAITDTIKRINRDMNNGSVDYYKIPLDSDTVAQYLLFYEMSLPAGLDLKSAIDIDKSSTRFTVTLANLSSQEILDLEARAIQWLKKNAPEIKTTATGPAIMFAHIGMTNIRSMLIGTAVALALISLILMATFRSISLGLLSAIPNFVPLVMAFGLWGMLDGQITLAIAVVSGMTLGIIVDDTVHLLARYYYARRNLSMTPENAIIDACDKTGFALLTTTVVLVVGFLVLSFSNYEVNSSMAILTMTTLIIALAVDLLVFPALLIFYEKRSQMNLFVSSITKKEIKYEGL